MQPRARGEHPAGENSFYLALQRHLVDFHESICICRLGRRPRVTGARGDLQRSELNGFPDRCVKRDSASGDLIEPGENGAGVLYLLCRCFRNHRVIRPRRGIGGLRRRRISGCSRGAVRWRWRSRRARRRRQGLRLDPSRRTRDALWRRIRLRAALLSGILLRRWVLSRILHRRRLRRKRSAGHVSRWPWRRITESAAELSRNRPNRERGTDHNQECGDSSHDEVVSRLLRLRWPLLGSAG